MRSGRRAGEMGFAHRAVPKADLVAAVQEEIDMIRLGGPIAVTECKKLVRRVPELSTEERAAVKTVAKELLTRLKELLVLNWRQKAAARSRLKMAIEDTLDTGLPRAYSIDLYREKCAALFEHVYESYPERDGGVYSQVA